MAETAKQLEGIVDNIVKEIEGRLDDRITNTITQYLQKRLGEIDFDSHIAYLASVKLDSMLASMELDGSVIEKRIKKVSDTVLESLKEDAKSQLAVSINQKLASMDLSSTVRTVVAAETQQLVRRLDFPNGSIPHRAINFDGVQLSGDNIVGGIITKFGSSGIDDRAEGCQVTILDSATVVENKLITNNLEVKGSTTLEGEIILRGQIPTDTPFFQDVIDTSKRHVLEGLDQTLFEGFSSTIFDKIRDNGIDLNRITINGNELIKGNQLSYAITDTNINRVGLLKELQVQGEALIADTFYVGNQRVGVNTMDPGHALSVWDQEVEVAVGKRSKDTAYFGTPRNQSMIIGANMQDNLIIGADGSVQVNSLKVNQSWLGSTGAEPVHAGQRGTVLFNDNPDIGQPTGWVCLGGARWAKFGIIG